MFTGTTILWLTVIALFGLIKYFPSISTLTVGFVSEPFYILYKQIKFAGISNMNKQIQFQVLWLLLQPHRVVVFGLFHMPVCHAYFFQIICTAKLQKLHVIDIQNHYKLQTVSPGFPSGSWSYLFIMCLGLALNLILWGITPQ